MTHDKETRRGNRRRYERRWRDRRAEKNPVLLDTRIPHDRRTVERRDDNGEEEEKEPRPADYARGISVRA